MITQANAKNTLKLARAGRKEDKPCESIHSRRTWSQKFLVAMNGV